MMVRPGTGDHGVRVDPAHRFHCRLVQLLVFGLSSRKEVVSAVRLIPDFVNAEWNSDFLIVAGKSRDSFLPFTQVLGWRGIFAPEVAFTVPLSQAGVLERNWGVTIRRQQLHVLGAE